MNGKQLKNSILQWAIQGKLVPQDPNDEPASVLLERIRAEKAQLIKEGKIKKDKNETIIFRGDDNSHYEKLPNGEVRCIDDEIPFEIPSNWCWVRLSQVVQINPKNKADDNIEAAFIPMELIDATYFSSFTFETKKWKTIKGGFTHFADGDIAFAKITPCFQNRKSMILQNLPNGIGAGTTELKVLRPYAKTINDFYLLFFLESAYFVEQATFKGTANQQRIISGYMENKLFPLPPIDEQERIAEKLKTLLLLADKYGESQIALNKLNDELPKIMKQSILQEAIQGRLVEQCEADEPATELLKRIQQEKQKLVKEGKLKAKDITDSIIYKGDDNKYYEKCGNTLTCIDEEIIFDVPKGWKLARLSNVAQIYTGNSISESEKKAKYTGVSGREYVGTKDVDFDCSVQYNNGVAIPKQYESAFKIAPAYSVLMCIEGGSAGRKTAIIDRDICFGNKLCCFAPFVNISKYIFYYLQSPLFFEMFNSGKTGIIGGVSVNNVKNLLIPIPPYQEMQRIIDKLEQALASIMSR